MRHLAAPIVLAFSLSFVSAGHAAQEEPKVTLEATLDAADEVPSPTGTLPGAGGAATFEYDETDKSIAYTVTVMNLTGPPLAAHIHQAPPARRGRSGSPSTRTTSREAPPRCPCPRISWSRCTMVGRTSTSTRPRIRAARFAGRFT